MARVRVRRLRVNCVCGKAAMQLLCGSRCAIELWPTAPVMVRVRVHTTSLSSQLQRRLFSCAFSCGVNFQVPERGARIRRLNGRPAGVLASSCLGCLAGGAVKCPTSEGATSECHGIAHDSQAHQTWRFRALETPCCFPLQASARQHRRLKRCHQAPRADRQPSRDIFHRP